MGKSENQNSDRQSINISDQERTTEKKIAKKKRARNGAKLGRPSPKQTKEFDIGQTLLDQNADAIKIAYMDYGTNIGVKKGFVLDRVVRQELNSGRQRMKGTDNISSILWSESHHWNEIQERTKAEPFISLLCQKYPCITNSKQNLLKLFVDISDIFASQFTKEVYDFLSLILGYCLGGEIPEQEYISQNLPTKFQSYYLIFPKFVYKKFKHKLQLVGNDVMKTELSNLFKRLIPLMNAIIAHEGIKIDS